MAKKNTPIVIENANIRFRNFSGLEKQFNPAGNRNFVIFLEKDIADRLYEDGWNIKQLAPQDEADEPQPYIQVSVSYGQRPPKVVLITSAGKRNIGEDLVDMLDYAEIDKVDLTLNPYHWEVNGKSGVKAYLKSIYVTLDEDELDRKYNQIPDEGEDRDAPSGPHFEELD